MKNTERRSGSRPKVSLNRCIYHINIYLVRRRNRHSLKALSSSRGAFVDPRSGQDLGNLDRASPERYSEEISARFYALEGAYQIARTLANAKYFKCTARGIQDQLNDV
jgi:hypothetical protein